MNQITGLQNISSYTLLQSPTKLADLVDAANDLGYSSLALTDINVTYGLVDFYKLAKAKNLKPLLGMQIRINGLVDTMGIYDLIAIAKNNVGYQNILRLSSAINLKTDNGTNDRVINLTDLEKYLENLFIITPANINSELRYLSENNPNLAVEYIRQLQNVIPKSSDSYLGVFADKKQMNYIDFISSLSKQFNIPLVAVEDTQYLKPKDQFLRKSLLAIKDGKKLSEINDIAKQDGSHYLKNKNELLARYHDLDLDVALDNANKIASTSDPEIEFKDPQLPKYNQNKFPTSQLYLEYLAKEGLKKRFANKIIPDTYRKRLSYELQVINQMGFDDYFLIVWDVINFAHRQKITTGPGRGSAAGSLVAYALKITEVDPLKYNLLFERFLNPSRAQMPDIDLDIPDNHRDEVIKYMFDKYGMDHAAQILTFGTLAAKQALRDCARIFGLTVLQSNKWAQAVPFSKTKITLKQAYKSSNELQIIVNATPLNKLLFETAKKIEGIPRHYSVHAAGLVISDNSIAKTVGLQAGPLGIPVTQQTKTNVEALGLLKIDFLGLRNLTILGNTLSLLNKEGIKLDPNKIPLNDPSTLKLFQDGNTDAIFQFESSGIRNVLKRLHPDSFEDIVAVNALYRPGPMQNIDTFIARKQGKQAVVFPDESLKKILAPTYGILVYQEQVMQTAQVLAGFSLGEADLLRRAMSKKDQDILDKQRDKFIAGAISLGHSKEVAQKVYNYIEQFANYGFNRSHAVAYSIIAFWLAYLKVHYPAAFFTALINSNVANKTKITDYIIQAQNVGVKILHPDINLSQAEFILYNGQILVGFKAIKGLRIDFIKNIVSLKHPIDSFIEFLRSINSKFLNSDSIMALIKAGCFDSIEKNRNTLLNSVTDMIENIKFTGTNIGLSETLGVKAKIGEMPDKAQKALMEEQVMGFSVTQTPLLAVEKYAQRFNAQNLNSFVVNQTGISVGKLMKYKPIKTKKGTTMAFATFADSTSSQEIIIFPRVYQKVHNLLKEGQIYLMQIRTQSDNYDNGKMQLLLTDLKQVNIKE